jgi:glycine/D-amino acid oxidase-like deaminating enzyme
VVFALIEKYGIDCEAVRAGTLHCAHSPAGLRVLKSRHRQLEARGAPVTLLSAEETAARTGTSRYFGALHDARAGTIQPLAYCAGLARAAAALGASIHEASKVCDVRREGAGWRVSMAHGTVRAKAVLRAVNAYNQALSGAGTPAFTPVSFFQAATKPLSTGEGAAILPAGEGCWDTARVMSSFRRDHAGRLIVGGIGGLGHVAAGIHLDWSRRKIARLFPQLADVQLDYAWHGRIAMTQDHIPKIVSAGPDYLSIFGYSGRGIGPGSVFGARAADTLLGSNRDLLPVRAIESYGEASVTPRSWLVELGATAFHAINSR